MDKTPIEIPNEFLAAVNLKPEDMLKELVRYYFWRGKLSAAQAAAFSAGEFHVSELPGSAEKVDLDAFLDWAAHDLRSPLNSVIGFTKVILMGIDGPLTDMQVTDLEAAHRNSLKMLTLINNLIDMARLNSGDLKIEFIEGNLAYTLIEVTNKWKSQNPSRDLHTDINLDNPICKYDPERIKQVISGLLTYAANHVAESGIVSLHARETASDIMIDIASMGDKAAVRHDLDQAMLSFICRKLASLHGGRLDIFENDLGGTRLNLVLPRN